VINEKYFYYIGTTFHTFFAYWTRQRRWSLKNYLTAHIISNVV